MNKEIILSIQPRHLANILDGHKPLELRKSIPKNFKGWVNLYCTKGKPYLVVEHYWTFLSGYGENKAYKIWGKWDGESGIANGLVVGRFWFDEYDTYNYEDVSYPEGYEDYDGTFVDTTKYVNGYYILNTELEKLCLSYDKFETYGDGKTLYAWYIKKLEIFDEPLELSDFGLKKAPQSWCYVYTKEEEKNDNT